MRQAVPWYFLTKWAIPCLFFFIFVFSTELTLNNCSIKVLPMIGFELRISGVGGDCSTNWATTTAPVQWYLPPFGSKWLFSALWPSSANFILTKEPGANNPNSLKLILVGLQRILEAADIVKFAMASVWPDWANFKSSLPKKSSKLAQIFGKFIGYFEVPNFLRKTYFGCFLGHQLETLGYF